MTHHANWSAHAPFRFAVGIEDTFIAHESPGQRKLDEYELTQHYQFWDHDLELVADSGADTLRWGIPWYRVETEPGKFAWDWVDRVADKISSLGLTCIVDLMHYGTPLWLDGSFANADYPDRVAAYAAKGADTLGDRFQAWTPLNEPVINALYCGQRGLWPPHLSGSRGFVQVLMQLTKGICLTQSAIQSIQSEAAFVHVDAGFRYEGDTRPLPLELMHEHRFLAMDLITGAVHDDHPMISWLQANGAGDIPLAWMRAHAVEPTVIGVNYYPAFTTVRYHVDGSSEPIEAGTAGLEDLLRAYALRYGKPLMITETSRGGTVQERRAWLSESLISVARLRDAGVPVIGYTWFPFMALVDWLYREASTPMDEWLIQMGLIDLALTSGGGTLERHPTALLDDFRKATRNPIPPVRSTAREGRP